MGPPVTGLIGKEKNHPFHGWIFIIMKKDSLV
jgi:hypothetical protein